MTDWQRVPVTAVAVDKGLVGGPFGSSLGGKDYVPTGVPVIRGVNLGSLGKFSSRGFVYVTPEKAHGQLARNLAIPGDVVFTQRGTLGQVGVVPSGPYKEYVISQSQMRLRVDRDVALPDFVYYHFKSPEMVAEIHNRAIATGVPHINLGILSRLEISLPPLKVQQGIVELLGALDDKIALDERLSDASLELARAVYSDAISVSGESTELGNCVSLKYGKALREPDRRPGEVPVFGCTGQVGWHDSVLTQHKGAVVGRKGANAGWVSWAPRPCWVIDTAFFADITRPDLSSELVFLLLETANLPSLVGDSAVPGLNRDAAHAKVVRVPSREAARELAERVSPLMLRSTQTQYESRALADLRDTLLPQLMSGKLRVRDAEKIVEDAA
ncbi:restriction endonuclease subunit S [Streptomyces bobili]|uniref:restriction endonuclease subunit S n=1 Tax=Streptomyces bobili TaxID=67280 RepID=UPI00365014B8